MLGRDKHPPICAAPLWGWACRAAVSIPPFVLPPWGAGISIPLAPRAGLSNPTLSRASHPVGTLAGRDKHPPICAAAGISIPLAGGIEQSHIVPALQINGAGCVWDGTHVHCCAGSIPC